MRPRAPIRYFDILAAIMLRFVARVAVRAAVRGAVRGAVYSHYENARQREAMARQMSGPFALMPSANGETALYQDRRAGFSHALPGRPRAIQAIPAPYEPAIDTLIDFADVPIFVRYRFDQPQLMAASAVDYAMQAAQTYAAGRVGGQPNVIPARVDQASRWSVEAAALATYALPGPDPFGADFEELIVLVRQATAMAITFRYARAQLDWLRQAFFMSAARATMCWDPQRLHFMPVIWPDGAFLEPSAAGALNAHKEQVLLQIAPAIAALSPPEKEAVSGALGGIIQREEPPWAQATPDVMGQHVGALLGCSQSPHYQAIVQQAAGEVRTMHDLRGLAVLLGRALG
jgi:hypothetical protein